SYQAIYLSFKHVYKGMGLSPLSFEQVKKEIGLGLSKTFADLLGEKKVEEALRLFLEKYSEIYRENTFLLPGAQEVLETLHRWGIRLAIATNKIGRFSRSIFRHFEMEQLFDAIVGDEDVSENKPHPEMLFFAMEKMGLAKEVVILVGDSVTDIITAKNAGIRVFAVPTGVKKREDLEKEKPDIVLNSLPDLLSYIKPRRER
ncbi:MAG: HAD-IA family hydrolase, partial [Candidatus Omnitrophota bacterium]